MKKRWLCGILALCLVLGMLPGIALFTSAYEEMQVSQELVDVVKKLEGFEAYPYWDYYQWTVGYGSECPDDKLDEYKKNGIPEEAAEELLREDLGTFEKEVNNFAKKYDLTFKQQEFDALVSLSYNCGGNWTRESNGILNNAIRNGATGSELIYAFGLYSRAGNDYILIKRRLCEANMYLNGVYKAYNKDKNAIPTNYKYVYLDGNGGDLSYAIHGYDANEAPGVRVSFTSIPTGVDASGNVFVYEFAGWSTASVGGTPVETLDGSLSNGTVIYAQWKDPSGNIVALPKGDAVDNLKITVTGSSVNVRTGPGTFYAKTGTVSKGSTVIISEVCTVSGTTWGKFSGGWISLSYTDYEDVLESLEPEPTWPRAGTVTGNSVNVRSGPGTGNPAQYQMNKGDRVLVSETYDDGKLLWGKLADGNWICLSYVEFDSDETSEPEPYITGITLVKGPDKTDYVQMQDPLDLQGSVLRADYSDGSATALTLKNSMITSYSNSKLGQVTVKAAYQGFTVSFSVNIIKATVTFLNYDGTVLSAAQYAYGDKVTQPEKPAKPADAEGEYAFTGWTPEVTACDGDATYTAVFELVIPEPPEEPDYIPGDFDGDQRVTEDDAVYLLRSTFFPEDYPVTIPADLNGDGQVTEDDAVYLLRHVFFPEDYPLTSAETTTETTQPPESTETAQEEADAA